MGIINVQMEKSLYDSLMKGGGSEGGSSNYLYCMSNSAFVPFSCLMKADLGLGLAILPTGMSSMGKVTPISLAFNMSKTYMMNGYLGTAIDAMLYVITFNGTLPKANMSSSELEEYTTEYNNLLSTLKDLEISEEEFYAL